MPPGPDASRGWRAVSSWLTGAWRARGMRGESDERLQPSGRAHQVERGWWHRAVLSRGLPRVQALIGAAPTRRPGTVPVVLPSSTAGLRTSPW